MKIYTRTGDDGTTSLSGGKRVPKNHVRVNAYGSIDELIAWIGLLRSWPGNTERSDFLLKIEGELMKCAAIVSSDEGRNNNLIPDDSQVKRLEQEIDLIEESLPTLDKFILPGGNQVVSYCHIARCVCRRAERALIDLGETEKVSEIALKYLNRLSDYLFILARKLSLESGNEDVKWLF
jgi:cob(I)alamin adenosyltransferase